MREKSGKEVHLIVNTLRVVQLLSKTSERFEIDPNWIPAIFGSDVKKAEFQFGSICAAFYMLFVLCKEINLYDQVIESEIDRILSKSTVVKAKKEGDKPKLKNLRNATAHGNIEPLDNSEFRFADYCISASEPYLVFIVNADALTEILNMAIKYLNNKLMS